MPAQSVDPGIDEEREYEAVEGAAHHHACEEGQQEIDAGHRATAEGLTARTYPVGGTGSRPGSDQRAVMPSRVRATGRRFYLAVWAMPNAVELPLASARGSRDRMTAQPAGSGGQPSQGDVGGLMPKSLTT